MNTKLILAWGVLVAVLLSLIIAMVLVDGFVVAVFATLGEIIIALVIAWAVITIVDN